MVVLGNLIELHVIDEMVEPIVLALLNCFSLPVVFFFFNAFVSSSLTCVLDLKPS